MIVREMPCEAAMEYACEGQEVSINCHSDVIHVINANYGRLGTELCADNIGIETVECAEANTSDIVRTR